MHAVRTSGGRVSEPTMMQVERAANLAIFLEFT
jgi:hypothetical protein